MTEHAQNVAKWIINVVGPSNIAKVPPVLLSAVLQVVESGAMTHKQGEAIIQWLKRSHK